MKKQWENLILVEVSLGKLATVDTKMELRIRKEGNAWPLDLKAKRIEKKTMQS